MNMENGELRDLYRVVREYSVVVSEALQVDGMVTN